MRNILTAALAIVFVSVQAISRLRTVVNQRAEVAQIVPSLPKLAYDFEYVGCFADQPQRAIPNFQGKVRWEVDCAMKAFAKSHDVFGVQYGGECWTGDINVNFAKYGKGPEHECKNPLGGYWTNRVFKKVSFKWQMVGCYKDDGSTSRRHFLRDQVHFTDPYLCQLMAYRLGFDIIYFMGNACWGDRNTGYGDLPLVNCPSHEQSGIGREFIYLTPATIYHYRGCFKDSLSRIIPVHLGKVDSIQACENLAKMGKYTAFGLENGGQCRAGNRPNFRMLGEETNKANCPPLGGFYSNQVYSIENS